MLRTALAVILAGFVGLAPAQAQQMDADDMKWINQCVDDNAKEPGGTPEIVRAYCICMNEQMDDGETRSVTEWEKDNPDARKECEKTAGWK